MNTYIIRLKEIRKYNKLFQKDIAKILDITQSRYSLYENRVRSIPIKKVIILSKYYNVSTDYLLGLTNERKPYPKAK